MKDIIVRFFPSTLRSVWEACDGDWNKIEEIRIRVDKPVMMIGKDREYILLKGDGIQEWKQEIDINTCVIYKEKELEELLRHLCRDSVYAYEEERRQGFLTLPGGHRVGITGELTHMDGQRYIAKYIRYMNIRIAHEVKGIAEEVMQWLTDGDWVYNTLIVSAPGVGKTTLLRDIVRNFSDGGKEQKGYSVGVIDERGEIAGAYRGMPSLDCGMRTDVITGGNKEQNARILIRTFAPRIIVMDEIGTRADAEAVLYAGISGCSVIATVHGRCWDDLMRKTEINHLIQTRVFQRILFLHKKDDGTRYVEIWNEEGVCLCGERLLQECLS